MKPTSPTNSQNSRRPATSRTSPARRARRGVSGPIIASPPGEGYARWGVGFPWISALPWRMTTWWNAEHAASEARRYTVGKARWRSSARPLHAKVRFGYERVVVTLRRSAGPLKSEGQVYGNSSFHQARAHSRSEEHTSELQSRPHLVCRLLL